MTILFLLAVLFAIPTSGLSLVAYFALFIFNAWRKAQDRIFYVDTMRAYRSAANQTEWSPRGEPLLKRSEDADVFWYGVFKLAERRRVPRLYSERLQRDQDFTELLRSILNSLDADGHSFTSRQIAAVDLIERCWERMGSEEQAMVRAAQSRGITAGMMDRA